jgi:ABC-2 type transport system ATP-binding protein
MIALEFTDVVKKYDEIRAVDNVSFAVQEGEIFGLLGPNGAGKTTSISMISTLEPLTSGDIKVFDRSVQEYPTWAKQRFGLVPQESVSHGFFDVSEILRFHSGYYGVTDNAAWIEDLLQRLGLWKHRQKRVSELSGGMRKRLAIAKAMVHKPPLLLLDEPTAGVDIELRDSLWDFIKELKEQNTTILLTTHYLHEAELLCDRVGIIDEGRIKKIGDTQALIAEMTTKEITITYAEEMVTGINGPYLIKQNGCTATFKVPHDLDFQALLASASIPAGAVRDVQVRQGTLEDAVRQIVTFQNGRTQNGSV